MGLKVKFPVKRFLFFIISILFYILRKPLFIFLKMSNAGLFFQNNLFLMYHEIKQHEQKKFSWQLDQILKIYRPMDLDDIKNANPENNKFVVTFDDAFEGFKKYALPELLKRDLASIVFVPTAYFGKAPGWATTPEDRTDGESIMTEDQIREITNLRVEIGSHSVNHVYLADCDRDQLRHEAISSKNSLEQLTGKQVRFFAFPFGSMNDRAVEAIKSAGYEMAFSVIPPTAFGTKDSFVSGRVGVSMCDWPIEFKLKISGAYNWVAYASALKSKMLSVVK